MKTEKIKSAKLRVIAKEFKKLIPIGMCIPLPDDLINKISTEQMPKFLDALESLGLQQNENAFSFGFWERRC